MPHPLQSAPKWGEVTDPIAALDTLMELAAQIETQTAADSRHLNDARWLVDTLAMQRHGTAENILAATNLRDQAQALLDRWTRNGAQG